MSYLSVLKLHSIALSTSWNEYCKRSNRYPSSVTFRNQKVAETGFIHQEKRSKIDSLQQSIDENQVVKNGWEKRLAQGQSSRKELLVE